MVTILAECIILLHPVQGPLRLFGGLLRSLVPLWGPLKKIQKQKNKISILQWPGVIHASSGYVVGIFFQFILLHIYTNY